MEGWIKLYDKMLEWQWYTDTNVKVLFLHCLLKANFADKRWQNIIIKRGQFKTTISLLAEELNLSPKQIRIALGKLQETNEINVIGANKYSLITVCKYEDYQQKNESEKQEGANKGQTKGKQRANKGQTTLSTTVIDNISNISDNKEKEEEKEKTPDITSVISSPPKGEQQELFPKDEIEEKPKTKRFVPPTIEEVAAYCQKRRNGIDAELFVAHYAQKGWKIKGDKMTDWKQAIITWEKRLKNNSNGIYNGQRQDRRGETPASDWKSITPEQMEF